jgi:4-hydroxy-2-oxoglutarate aldolase
MFRVPLDLAGILPPVATPFVDDEVDLAAMRANCERWMRTGLRGVLLLGTNGEAPLIRDEEAVRLVAAAREAVPEDRVLLVGTGRQATRDVIALSRAVAREGADAVLVLTPSVYRNQLTPGALSAHYRAIADGSPVPVVLYNMPQATGVALTPAIVRDLASHPNIAGIKESSGDVAVVADLVGRAAPGFPVVVGAAPSLYASLMVGATGGIVAIANVVPDLCVRLFELARANRHEEALALQRALTPLAAAVTTGFGVPGLKAAMALAGYRPGQPRRPLAPLGEEDRRTIRGLFETLSTRAEALTVS